MAEQHLISIALIIIVILYFLSYNLYIDHSYKNGSSIGFIDTLKNIFNVLPDFDFNFNINNKVDGVEKSIKQLANKPLFFKRKKEVFNIDSNDFTYDEAPLVCESVGSTLATYNQVLNAHKEGASWCNYGWSANQLALYPIQKDSWEKIQQGPLKNMCGKPGVNGGHFDNKNIKLGVNCYGYKKTPDPSKIIYQEETSNNKIDTIVDNKIDTIINTKNIEIRPFNTNKWSRYSYKKSSYIINPDYIDPTINKTTQITDIQDDTEKDPQSINIPTEEEE
uniref:Link domain-containing protein n=1 Tax=viral metagenome TaxID=1070528 RepID=A0A6C0EJD3_9ZZZZ